MSRAHPRPSTRSGWPWRAAASSASRPLLAPPRHRQAWRPRLPLHSSLPRSHPPSSGPRLPVRPQRHRQRLSATHASWGPLPPDGRCEPGEPSPAALLGFRASDASNAQSATRNSCDIHRAQKEGTHWDRSHTPITYRTQLTTSVQLNIANPRGGVKTITKTAN